jgi:hypothetical protein
MRILCLEQGDWTQAVRLPQHRPRLGSARGRRLRHQAQPARLPADYPINDDDSPIKVANFNGVGGGTILYAGHFPRLHPSDFRVRRSTASPTTGRSTTARSSRSTR